MLKQHPCGFLFFANVPTHIPLSPEDSPARAAHVELAWRDPEAARRARHEQRVMYWRSLVERRRANVEAAKQALARARTPGDRFDARAELEACEAELLAAEQALAEAERCGR
jgi:multidrug resistance efflux pump